MFGPQLQDTSDLMSLKHAHPCQHQLQLLKQATVQLYSWYTQQKTCLLDWPHMLTLADATLQKLYHEVRHKSHTHTECSRPLWCHTTQSETASARPKENRHTTLFETIDSFGLRLLLYMANTFYDLLQTLLISNVPTRQLLA